jgi:hypothetical protein
MQRVIATNESSSDFSILPEPESRYGLSLAHNDAFATIARSMFLACTFVSTSETLRIRSIPDSFAPSGFEAEPGRRQRPEPVSRSTLRYPEFVPDLHSPSGLLSKTLQIKAFDRFKTRKLVSPDVRLSLTPRCFLLRFRFGSVLETRSV